MFLGSDAVGCLFVTRLGIIRLIFIELAKSKLEALFLEAYEAHVDAIFRYCLFKLSDRERAKDATQEIFVRFWQYVSAGNTVSHVRAFLFTSAANYVKDQWKKKKSIPLSMLDPVGEDAQPFDVADPDEATIETQTEYHIALRSFKRLSDSDQVLLQMRFVEDMAVKDIARALGERENTIAVRISRALSYLRKHFT